MLQPCAKLSGTQRLEKQRPSDQVHLSHRVAREWIHWKQCCWIFKLQAKQTDDPRMIFFETNVQQTMFYYVIPVVPHKTVAEVSKIGNL